MVCMYAVQIMHIRHSCTNPAMYCWHVLRPSRVDHCVLCMLRRGCCCCCCCRDADDALCAVCGEGHSEAPNQILFCERCDVPVHQVGGLGPGCSDGASSSVRAWCLRYCQQSICHALHEPYSSTPDSQHACTLVAVDQFTKSNSILCCYSILFDCACCHCLPQACYLSGHYHVAVICHFSHTTC
jgi:hypothetical protein